MATIITCGNGQLAYHTRAVRGDETRAFGLKGDFHRTGTLGFAGLSVFAANGNHAPSGREGAVTCDLGRDLLFRIAGAL